ncbi:MAG: NADH-quinone oxidoreductase subunit A [Armatimonadota bacterium]|nr:NADH-quinone oxidoreductase subunit A [bacterium]
MLAKDFLTVAVFIIVGIAFVVITLIASWFFRPHRPNGHKLDTYECGERPVGPAWLQFRVGYYIYALVFLVFDVEAVFLFPWAAGLLGFSKNRALAVLGLVDMVIFVAVLVVGLVWAYEKGVLEWK